MTNKTPTVYFANCQLCNKRINGTSPGAVEYNLKSHEKAHSSNFKEIQGIKLDFSKKKEVKKK
jgi:hypothetical protein